MSIWLILLFAVILVGCYVLLRRQGSTTEGNVEAKPLTTMAGLGFGILVLGILILLMPSTSARIAALETVQSEPFAILVGISYLLGAFVVLAGLAVLLVRERME